MEFLEGKLNYFIYIILMVLGLYGMTVHKNLFKKLIGMNIFQWAIILFFISVGAKRGGTIPIVDPKMGIKAELYINPLPHVLMLTAIVVAVSTTGIALALLILIYRKYGILEEDRILRRIREK